jgi:hypothetical protein
MRLHFEILVLPIVFGASLLPGGLSSPLTLGEDDDDTRLWVLGAREVGGFVGAGVAG